LAGLSPGKTSRKRKKGLIGSGVPDPWEKTKKVNVTKWKKKEESIQNFSPAKKRQAANGKGGKED